jgi:predicted PurR-regulated permease PerM
MTNPQTRPDYLRSALLLVLLGSLIALTFWVLRPFLPAMVWSTMIVIATWPMMRSVQDRCWGKRWIAVTIMIIGLLLVLVIPLTMGIVTLVDNSAAIVEGFKTITSKGLPPPPAWIEGLPMVGGKLKSEWQVLADSGPTGLLSKVQPYLDQVLKWLAAEVGAVGALFFHFLLTLVISGLLYSNGETAARSVRRLAQRIGGDRAVASTVLAAKSVRAVALGIVVTALVQSVLGGVGLAVTGVPQAALLSAVMFIFAIAQLGVFPVLVPAIVWLYWRDETGWGTVLLLITLVVGTVDNVLRPVLIRKGADLPLVLIFSGVIGGLLAFGIIGLFIGPVVLAVMYTITTEWVLEGEQSGNSTS